MNDKRKWVLLVGVLVMLLFIFTGCGNKVGDGQKDQEAETIDFPSRAIDLMIPYDPGGGSDNMARIVELFWNDEFGNRLNFNYRSGAGGAVGMKEFADSASADGYSIATFNFPQISMQIAAGQAAYKIDDFEVFCQVAADYAMFVVPVNSPFETLDDFVNAAKNNPGTMNISLSGVNDSGHMLYVNLIDQADIHVPRVTYQSGGEQLSALLGEHVNSGIGTIGTLGNHVLAGELRALAVASARRLEKFPDVPTFTELGYSDAVHFTGRIWLTPAGVDPVILDRLEKGFKNIVDNPEFRERLEGAGFTIAWMGREEITKHILQFHSKSDMIMQRLKEDLEKFGR